MVARLLLLLSLVLFAPAIFPASIDDVPSEDRFAPSATLAAFDEEMRSSLDLLAIVDTDAEQGRGGPAVPLFPDALTPQAPPGGGETIAEPSTLVLIGAGLIVGFAREVRSRSKVNYPA